jgi:hypothetical protein
MNIHECVSCDVGRLKPTDNHTAISEPIFFMYQYGLRFAEGLQFYKSG